MLKSKSPVWVSILSGLMLVMALLLVTATPGSTLPATAAPNTSTSATSSSLMWRVQTPLYTIGTNTISVAEYGTNDQPGAPALPVTRKLFELPQTGEWNVDYTGAAQAVSLPAAFRMAAVPVPAKDRSDFTEWSIADMGMAVETVDRPDEAIYGRNAFYPNQPVITGEEVWQRGRRLLAVTVFPFQYNPAGGDLRYYPDITVTVTMRGSDSSDGTLRGNNSNIPQPNNLAANPEAGTGSVRINTLQAGGLTRLTYSELQAAGVPVAAVNPATFAMSYLGNPIRILVTGEGDGTFDPGDLVIFYAEPYVGRYMTSNVYWLRYGGANGLRMTVRTVPQNTGITPTTLFTETTHLENNLIYVSTIAAGLNTDNWWDNAISPNNSAPPGSATKSVVYTLPLDDPAQVGTVHIRANVHGLTNQSYNPDHAVRLTLNGTNLGTFAWEGEVEYVAQGSTAGSVLSPTTNQLTITAALEYIPGCPPDCPFSYTVYPNWVEADYAAITEAEGDKIQLDRVATGAERVRVTGLSLASGGNARVFDLRDPANPVVLATTSATNAGSSFTLDFWDSPLANPAYAVSTDAALNAPVTLRRDNPSTWGTPANSADYIAITHELFYTPTAGFSSLNDLLAHRQAEGIQTVKIDVQDIYDEFSGGRKDPQAIRDFLTYAYFNWNAGGEPPEYVLLVGDGSLDYQNNVGSPNIDYIPPYLMNVDPFLGEVPVDNRFVSVDGMDDYVPDMAIGRLPAQVKLDLAQQNPPAYLPAYVDLDAMVDKIIGYETTAAGGTWQSRATFVADNFADPAGNFHVLSDHIIDNWLPQRYTPNRIYLNSGSYPSAAAVRTGIKQAFNDDYLLVQWFGHASAFRWGSQSVYNIQDTEGYGAAVPLNVNDQFALTVSYSCVSSYFASTFNVSNLHYWQSLGESLIRAPSRASVADIGPTGNHVGSAMLKLNEGIIQSALQNREDRAGLILQGGKEYYIANATFFFDLLDSSVLLGDPATKLRLPPIAHGASTFGVDDTTPNPNQTVQFSLTVANTGTTTLTDTLLVVDYDETTLSITGAGGWNNNGTVLTQTIGTLPPGGVVRTFTAQVSGSVTNGQVIDTPATVTIARENVFLNAPMTVVVLPTATPTITHTPTTGPSPTATGTNTPGPSPTPTNTPTITNTPTTGPSPTATATNTPGPSPTPTNTPTITLTPTTGPSPTATSTHTPGPSPTPTNTPTVTYTPTAGPSPTATTTGTPIVPTATATATTPPGGGDSFIFMPLIRKD